MLQLVPTSFIADVIHQHELVQRCPGAQALLLQAYRYHNSAKPDVKAVRHQSINHCLLTVS